MVADSVPGLLVRPAPDPIREDRLYLHPFPVLAGNMDVNILERVWPLRMKSDNAGEQSCLVGQIAGDHSDVKGSQSFDLLASIVLLEERYDARLPKRPTNLIHELLNSGNHLPRLRCVLRSFLIAQELSNTTTNEPLCQTNGGDSIVLLKY